MIYILLVWFWEDASIKIAKEKEIFRNMNSDDICKTLDVAELGYASSSIRNLIGIIAGISTLQWFVEQSARIDPTMPTGIGSLIGLVLGFYFIFLGSAILLGIMYYRSGVHELFVNNLRLTILQTNKEREKQGKEFWIYYQGFFFGITFVKG